MNKHGPEYNMLDNGQMSMFEMKEEISLGDGGHEMIVDQPDHYKHATFEVIDEMVIAFGIDATINFCILNAWKYRARAPYKGNMKQDMEKADRYIQYAHDLQLKKDGKLPLIKSAGKKLASQSAQEGKKNGNRR